MLLFKLPIENNKHPNFEWRGGERGVDSFVLCSYPIWVRVSTILSPIFWIAKWPYMLKKTNSTHLLLLGYETLGGTFFCYDWCNHAHFKTLLEYGYFIIFSVTWQFHVTLNMPWHHAMWRVPQNFLFFPLSKQGTPKVKKTENKIVADSFVLFSYTLFEYTDVPTVLLPILDQQSLRALFHIHHKTLPLHWHNMFSGLV